MVQRLQGIGLTSNATGSDNIAILSQFDAQDIPDHMREKLNGDHCKGKFSHTTAKSSLNLKHYSAYYDMIRHGYRFGLVMEDDASYEDGSKIIEAQGKRKEQKHFFSTHLGYNGNSFVEVLNGEIVPELPVAGNALPPKFQPGPVPAKRYRGSEPTNVSTYPDVEYNFDFLQLAACDGNILLIEDRWNRQSPNGYQSATWKIDKWKTHLYSAVNGCTRCAISYIVSLRGAAKVLASGRGFCGSIDISLMKITQEAMQKGNTFNCLHTYPNIAWEDPGPEGDAGALDWNG